MRIRRAVNAAINIATLAGGIGVGAGLVALGITGSVWQSLVVILAVGGILGSLMSLDVAIFVLLGLALVEGIYKALAPSLLTLAAKDAVLALIVLHLIYNSLRSHDFSWLSQRVTTPMLLFFGYVGAMVFSTSTRSLRLALAGVRSWILWMPLYFPAYYVFNTREKALRLIRFLIAVSIPAALYGIYQSVMGYGHLGAVGGFAAHAQWFGGRATSFFNTPHTFGGFCAIVTLLCLSQAMSPQRLGPRVVLVAIGALAAGGLVASGTRGALYGIFFGLLMLLWLARRRVLLVPIVAAGAAVAVFYLAPVAQVGAERLRESSSMRIAIARVSDPFETAIKQVSEHPLGYGVATGAGSGRIFGDLTRQAAANEVEWVENEFGRALTELGIPGTFFWLWTLWVTLSGMVRATRAAEDERDHYMFAGMTAAMTCVCGQLLIGSALYDPLGGSCFWLFSAATTRLVHERQRALAAEAQRQDEDDAETGMVAGGSFR